MKLFKIAIAFALLVSLQIAAAQWLHVPPPVEAKMMMPVVGGGVPVAGGGGSGGTYLGKPTDGTVDVEDLVSTGTDHTWTSGSGVTALVLWCGTSTITGVSLNSQAFTRAADSAAFDSATCQQEIWYLPNNTSSGTEAVIIDFDGTDIDYPVLMALEFSNILESSPLDVASAQSKTSATTQTAPAQSTTQNGDVCVAVFNEWNDHTSWTAGGTPATWTLVGSSASYRGAYYLSSTTGSHQVSVTVDSQTDNNYQASMLCLKTNP